MAFNYSTLNLLRQNRPVWHFLCTRHTLLVGGVLRPLFIVSNVRILSQADLIKAFIDAQWLADFDTQLDEYLARPVKPMEKNDE